MTGELDAIVIGAGFGGLAAAIKLRQAGYKRLAVLEKADRLGGTWRDNTYPGAACDVPSRLYSYSFALNPFWSRAYSGQTEIQKYMEDCADRFGVRAALRFNTEVERADWDETSKLWRVAVKGGQTLTAPALICAVGQLNRPSFANIPGLETFKGQSWHSARWRHDIDLAGKTVGCIGSGASAIQYIPQIAKSAGRVVVFQRSPNYIIPRLDKPTPGWLQGLFAAFPPADRAMRWFIWQMMDLRFRAFKRGTKAADSFRKLALGWLEKEIPDPELRAKLTPDYPIGCKRILISDDYYAALRQPNVELVTEGVKAITAQGVRTVTGKDHPCDVLVYGTGFDTTHFLAPMEIAGQGGRTLSDAWKDGAEAYLGVTVAGFPNLFMLYGPNTNLGHNSIIVMIEAQCDYIVKCLDELKRRGAKAMVVTGTAQAAFNTQLQKDLEATAWAGECSSWYKTASGKITNNWSDDTANYRKRTARPQFAHYGFA